MGRGTKLWEIRGEEQKRNQEIRNRMKTKNGNYGWEQKGKETVRQGFRESEV